MAKYEAKTKANLNSVLAFINAVPDQQRRIAAHAVMEIMKVEIRV